MKYHFRLKKYGVEDSFKEVVLDLPKKKGDELKELISDIKSCIDWEFSDPMIISFESDEDIENKKKEIEREKKKRQIEFLKKCGDDPGRFKTEMQIKMEKMMNLV